MKMLYVVSTYYHSLISCIKQLIQCDSFADIAVTDYIPEGRELADRIRNSGLFRETYYIGHINEYTSHNIFDYAVNQHKKNAELIEHQLPFSFTEYEEINVFHDDIWASRYLKDRRIRYRLMEDALDSFKTISQTAFSYMLPTNKIKTAIKKAFHIGYLFCGMDKSTVEIEVNDKSGVQIAYFAEKKLKEVPRKQMFDRLSDEDWNVISSIFVNELPDIKPRECIILLTQPLYEDGLVTSLEVQLNLYHKFVMDNMSDDKMLVIKPHPRDTADYSALFPDSVILNKNMPSEVMNHIFDGSFYKALTFFSLAAKSINADQIIQAGFNT